MKREEGEGEETPSIRRNSREGVRKIPNGGERRETRA